MVPDTQRRAMHDDPVVYALEDQASLGIGLLVMVTILAAL